MKYFNMCSLKKKRKICIGVHTFNITFRLFAKREAGDSIWVIGYNVAVILDVTGNFLNDEICSRITIQYFISCLRLS